MTAKKGITMKSINAFSKICYARKTVSTLMIGLLLSALPQVLLGKGLRMNPTAQTLLPSVAELESPSGSQLLKSEDVVRALAIVRDAAGISSSDAIKDDLKEARKALEEVRSERDSDDLALQKLQRARTILRQIIDDPRGEADGVIEKIAEALRIVEQASAPSCCGVGRATLETGFGLHVATFDTLQGTVTVNLPDDLQAGDTISGSVIAEPKGKTETEQAQNQSELNGYVVQIDKEQVPANKQYAKLLVPAAVTAITVLLKNREGKEIARTQLPAIPTPQEVKPNPAGGKSAQHYEKAGKDGGPGAYETPAIGQAGKPIEIKGGFDGDLTTSVVNIANRAVRVLAKSPRKLIAQTPTDVIGKADIQVLEQGQLVAQGKYQSVAIRLSADKLNLTRGEQTTMTMTLVGVDGIEAPITVLLVNRTPWVVRMSGGERQLLVISSPDVRGGTYKSIKTLTGVQAGGFSINATVVNRTPTDNSTSKKGLAEQQQPPPKNVSAAQRAVDGAPQTPIEVRPIDSTLQPGGDRLRVDPPSSPRETEAAVFRVSLNGFTVNNESDDDVLESDGRRDEVFVTGDVGLVDRMGHIVYERPIRSVVMGDADDAGMHSGMPRIRAGRGSDQGGLRTGDSFPDQRLPWARFVEPRRGRLPLLLWEGRLTRGENIAVIVPLVWEWDSSDESSAERVWRITNIRWFERSAPELLRLLAEWPSGRLPVFQRSNITFDSSAGNRPIGMRSDEGQFFIVPQALVLSYDSAMEAVRSSYTASGVGVVQIRYTDSNDHGDYTLYLQVERRQ